MRILLLAGLRGRRRRFVGTFVATFVGVAFLTGTMVLGATLTNEFDQLFARANADVDVLVRPVDAVGQADIPTTSVTLPEELVADLVVLDTVRAAQPEILGYGQLVGVDGQLVGGNGPPALAGNWLTDPDLFAYRLAEGRAPRADDEIVVNRSAAEQAGVGVGDEVTVRTPAPVQARVVGTATFADADGFGGVTFVGFTLEAAQRHLLGGDGQVSSVRLRAVEGVSQQRLADEVTAVLPSGAEAITGEALTREQIGDLAADFLDAFTGALLVFSGIALVVAAFSIANTFSILVAQRTREWALIRSLGASRRQVFLAEVAEVGAVGVTASTTGVAGGIGIAMLLKSLFRAFGFDLPTDGLTVVPGQLLLAAGIGVTITLLAGLLPARKAARVAPLDALRIADRAGVEMPRRRIVAGIAMVVGAAAAATLAIATGDAAPAAVAALFGLGGAIVLGPAGVSPLGRLVGMPLARFRGSTGVLARENAIRDPRRTAGAASALLVGVAVVTLMTVVVASLVASLDRRVANVVAADLVIAGGAFSSALSPDLADAIDDLDEVSTAIGIGVGQVRVGDDSVGASLVDGARLRQLVHLEVADGVVDELAGGTVALARPIADANGWGVGDAVAVTFPDGEVEALRLVAIYEPADVVGPVLIERSDWQPHAAQDIDTLVVAGLVDGVGTEEGREALAAVARAFGSPDVLTGEEYVEDTAAFLRNNVLGLVYVLLAFAVLIALAGIGNTLSLAIHERRRELGLLRAVGQTRAQQRAMIRWEAVIVATLGTVGGLGIGIAVSALLVEAARRDGLLTTLALPTGSLIIVLVVGAAAGLVAGVRPARQAIRRNPLDAIAAP